MRGAGGGGSCWGGGRLCNRTRPASATQPRLHNPPPQTSPLTKPGPSRALGFSYLTDAPAPVRVFAATADVLVPIASVRAWAAAAGGGDGGGGGGGGGVELIEVEGATHDGVFHTHKRAALEAIKADLKGKGRR